MATPRSPDHDKVRIYQSLCFFFLVLLLNSISLIDRTTQYFLAGACRHSTESTNVLSLDRAWLGCSNIPTPGGLCEVCSNPHHYLPDRDIKSSTHLKSIVLPINTHASS